MVEIHVVKSLKNCCYLSESSPFYLGPSFKSEVRYCRIYNLYSLDIQCIGIHYILYIVYMYTQ